jgi:hypothetical protein
LAAPATPTPPVQNTPSSAPPAAQAEAAARASSRAELALDTWRAEHPHIVELAAGPQASRWYYAARALADRVTMPTSFDEVGFKVERGSLLLVTQIRDGVEQPRYHYYTLADTGWAPAPKHFVPASTVKLMASLSALWTLSKHGLDGDATLSFKDIDGRFYGSAFKLYKDALLHSSNQNYNRLMAIAGFDETNTEYLTPERGFPIMAIQSRYGSARKSYGIRVSPKIGFKDGERSGEFPKRKGEWRTDACRGNCTTLFELQDIMRRVRRTVPLARRFGSTTKSAGSPAGSYSKTAICSPRAAENESCWLSRFAFHASMTRKRSSRRWLG